MKDKTRAKHFGFPLNERDIQQKRIALERDHPDGERGHVCWQIQNLITAGFDWNISPIPRLEKLFPRYTWRYWNFYNDKPSQTRADFLKIITSSDFLWPVDPSDLSVYEWVTASDWNRKKHLQILASPDVWEDLEWSESDFDTDDDDEEEGWKEGGDEDDNKNEKERVPIGPPSERDSKDFDGDISDENPEKAFNNFCDYFKMNGEDMKRIFKELKKPY
jgi:hypothetical protein